MHSAIVQVPAFREPDLLESLTALSGCYAPDGWEVDRQVWVTPDHQDRESDPTWRDADGHPEFEAVEAPPFKLSARNAAHQDAVSQDYDAFLVFDADCKPLRPDLLERMLTPLERPDVVATNSRPRCRRTPFGLVANVISTVYERGVRPYLHGQCSAMTTDAWELAGPFRENIDQTDINTVWREEEWHLYDRLEQLGEIVQPQGAVVLEDERRLRCYFQRALAPAGRPVDDYCDRQGTETFEPRYIHERDSR